MNRHLLLFGGRTNFANGSLPDCLAMTLRTGGLNGTIQPYSIFVSEPQRDGPYEQRSKLTTDPQDDALYQKKKNYQDGKMITTEYTKGHGIASATDDKKTDSSSEQGDSSNNIKETVHIVHINPYNENDNSEKDNLEDKSVKMSKLDFERKLHEFSENNLTSGTKRSKNEAEKGTKKKKTHKFQLF